jgi:hypothetical protein
VFDLWQDPQERYDHFYKQVHGITRVMVTISDAIRDFDENLRAVSGPQTAGIG